MSGISLRRVRVRALLAMADLIGDLLDQVDAGEADSSRLELADLLLADLDRHLTVVTDGRCDADEEPHIWVVESALNDLHLRMIARGGPCPGASSVIDR